MSANAYMQHTLTDLAVTGTAHHIAASYYRACSHWVKLPQAIVPVLVLFASALSTLMSLETFNYVNQALSVLSLLLVGIDTYFGWAKHAQIHYDLAIQYLGLRDRLFKLKFEHKINTRQKIEHIENEFLVLLSKNPRPDQKFQDKALMCMKTNQKLIDQIENRRSESSGGGSTHNLTPAQTAVIEVKSLPS